ncbi:hypothetical protein [Algoriphagus confluentis]|uniref:DUF4345 domain-containing protein n=1 Tax=Algoriphagus confluentis TaxID=1697556 RepID=A0ABQ6PQC8_9BACT|nr:hypothetical protein Aconfl_27980 [Algoriphagus confluentis]
MKKIYVLFLILGFIVGAIGYWTADFSKKSVLFDSLFYIKAPGTLLIAVFTGFINRREPASNALLISFGVMLGMLSRIVFDLIQDPSSHNLFPFELFIGAVVIFPVSFLGNYLVYAIMYLSGKG